MSGPGYGTLEDVKRPEGLRLLMVAGLPSPWGQAAKTIFELKGLPFRTAAWAPGGANEDIVAWCGIDSAPIVAWQAEKPVHTWLDILHLAERLAPEPRLIPARPVDRALMIGLSHEVCGEMGIGWNRRLQMFAPAMESGSAPEGVARMGGKYRYNRDDWKRAGERTAESLKLLTAQLETQYAKGVKFFVGDALSALDLYWVAFMNMLAPLPAAQCPIPEAWKPAFVVDDPAIKAAMAPILVEHRDRIFQQYFKDPMEF